MTPIGPREKDTQQRVIRFFRDALGYAYLGDWTDHPHNRNIETQLLAAWLTNQGHDARLIHQVQFALDKAAALGGSRTLYEANHAVYGLLRYGVKVKPDVDAPTRTVWLIDWEQPERNHFALAEEVTITGAHTKRPDLVLYVNGLALGVLELKRSTVAVSEGIRQNLDNQQTTFIRPFFTTLQLLLAGNETEGLRYGVIETPEKHWLRWKETETHPEAGDNPLLRELGQLCRKDRLLEIIHDFMVFDAGIKKTCRHNQYFGVRAAQERVQRREGGILWHTQGSGKSLTMVWLAQWIRERIPESRVLILTDRTKLDEQITRVFQSAGETFYRAQSGADLIQTLAAPVERLIGALIHKFGASQPDEETDLSAFVAELQHRQPAHFHAPGQMKLLIVVDKLLTGFDAPPATYLYLDKSMQDHTLFQAICRVNRLDGVDKEYGYIIDYKDLFHALERSVQDYTGEALAGYDAADVAGLLKDRLTQGRERLEEARETIKALCEPVAPPRDAVAYLHFFVAADSGNAAQIQANEPKRIALYQQTAALLRAYANLANELPAAGYSAAEAQTIKAEVAHYETVRQQVKLASGDYVDLKLYEPAMRHLLDTYLHAEESRKLSALEDHTLMQLIVYRGAAAVDALPPNLRDDPEVLAETIENNVRRLIVDESPVNPKYYETMSELLDALIRQRQQQAIDYQTYLAQIVALAQQVQQPTAPASYPPSINNPARRALYDNLKDLSGLDALLAAGDQMADPPSDVAEAAAWAVDAAIRRVKKADWRGQRFKEREIQQAIRAVLPDAALVDTLFEIVKAQRDY